MKKQLSLIIGTLAIFGGQVLAGNPDRSGEAGAYELNVNSWGRTSSFLGMNSACVKGIEATRLNTAGLAFTNRTEAAATYTNWFTGSGVSIATAGLAFRPIKKDKNNKEIPEKSSNIFALDIQSVNFGRLDRTTYDIPEGGIGYFKPTFLNIGLSYGKRFSSNISGGVTLRMVTQIVENVTATGLAVDAGVMYVTGPRDNVHFGVSIRNIGTSMRFGGDGFTFRGQAPQGDYELTLSQRSEKFSLPSQLNIGAAYDLYFGKAIATKDGTESTGEAVVNKKGTAKPKTIHRMTFAADFTSNSFGRDWTGLGIEYAYKSMFMLRAAYRYESENFKKTTSATAFNGFAAGASFETATQSKKRAGSKEASRIGIDYSYQLTRAFKGNHVIGLRFSM